jgi:hypothetical protein
MIRSIAYEIFDRLTTDPDALRKQVAKARADRDSVDAELLEAKDTIELISERKTFSRRKLESDDAAMSARIEELMAERDALQLQVRELQATTCKVTITSDTIEPTWILALWSVHAEGWTEANRGSYDSMVGEMRKAATAWQLFPRSQWDALVKNGRAR